MYRFLCSFGSYVLGQCINERLHCSAYPSQLSHGGKNFNEKNSYAKVICGIIKRQIACLQRRFQTLKSILRSTLVSATKENYTNETIIGFK